MVIPQKALGSFREFSEDLREGVTGVLDGLPDHDRRVGQGQPLPKELAKALQSRGTGEALPGSLGLLAGGRSGLRGSSALLLEVIVEF